MAKPSKKSASAAQLTSAPTAPTNTENTTMANVTPTKPEIKHPTVGTVIAIALDLIEVPTDWNSRSAVAVEADGNDAMSTGFMQSAGKTDDGTEVAGGLLEAIRISGQDTPVDVRLNPDTRSPKPYVLVTGFRRYSALRRLADTGTKLDGDPKWNPKAPTIKATFRGAMTDAEARLLNMRENVARKSLSVPDQAFGIKQLAVTYGMTDTAIAQHLNMTQGYVSKLHRIVNKLPADVLTDWRKNPKPPQANPMADVVRFETEGEMRDAYNRLVKKPAPEGAAAGDPAIARWYKRSEERVTEAGRILGHGFRIGVVNVSEADREKVVRHYVANLSNNPAYLARLPELIAAFASAYKDGQDGKFMKADVTPAPATPPAAPSTPDATKASN